MTPVTAVPSTPAPAPRPSPTRSAFLLLRDDLDARIVGQRALIERLLIALLADGHLLVEGAPGLAKTTAIKELAARIEGDFQRVQFTPDLLPGDLTGTDIYRPEQGRFEFQPGPLFHNLVLADEVNRAPAKVQSALLEAMGEHQITVGTRTYPLPEPFLVMATQNPIEHEGTYPLPEAQLDRSSCTCGSATRMPGPSGAFWPSPGTRRGFAGVPVPHRRSWSAVSRSSPPARR